MKEILRTCPLFEGIQDSELMPLLDCLGSRILKAKRGQIIFAEGTPARYLGLVLQGSVRMEKTDFYGNRSIVGIAEQTDTFGESFACAQVSALPVSVVAHEEASVLLLDIHKLTRTCAKACGFHSQIIFNLLKMTANKNLAFHRKIQVTSQKTTRGKLLAYLSLLAKASGSPKVTVPFDRQGLADYLGVDRSGLSAEIGKLQKEQLLLCCKNEFTLL